MANITYSEIEFRLDQLLLGAQAIVAEPERVDQVYAEIVARLKEEAATEQRQQEDVDALAESTPEDLAEYPQREV